MIPNSKEKQSFLQTSGQDAGTQCLSRTRSVFRGHTVPLAPTADARRLFAPTADARRLFAPTAFPTKANGKEFAFCSIGEALQKQGKNLHKGNHRSPTTCKK